MVEKKQAGAKLFVVKCAVFGMRLRASPALLIGVEPIREPRGGKKM